MGLEPGDKVIEITLPADFLVDENGTIQVAWYGKDEGDHLPINDIKAFSQK